MYLSPHFVRALKKRPEIKLGWCLQAVQDAEYREEQPDGRIRHWRFIKELGKYLRVVTESDGETMIAAFQDRSFRGPR